MKNEAVDEIVEFMKGYGIIVSKANLSSQLENEIYHIKYNGLSERQFKRNLLREVFQKRRGCSIIELKVLVQKMKMDKRWMDLPDWATYGFEIRYNDFYEKVGFIYKKDHLSLARIEKKIKEDLSAVEWFYTESEMNKLKLERLFGEQAVSYETLIDVENKINRFEVELKQQTEYETMNELLKQKISQLYDKIVSEIKKGKKVGV